MEPKVIIVTGASRGIGLAIARFLIGASHKVFLVSRSQASLQALKDEAPGQVEYLAADLSDLTVSSMTASTSYLLHSKYSYQSLQV
jgi:NADP-dependent 3-hydroxy acid dehydrogenase YdfG